MYLTGCENVYLHPLTFNSWVHFITKLLQPRQRPFPQPCTSCRVMLISYQNFSVHDARMQLERCSAVHLCTQRSLFISLPKALRISRANSNNFPSTQKCHLLGKALRNGLAGITVYSAPEGRTFGKQRGVLGFSDIHQVSNIS